MSLSDQIQAWLADSRNWGTLSSYLAIAVGLLAGAAALWSSIVSKKQLTLLVNDRLSEQAQKVAAWSRLDDGFMDQQLRTYLYNSSHLPIRNVRLSYWLDQEKVRGDVMPEIPPAATPEEIDALSGKNLVKSTGKSLPELLALSRDGKLGIELTFCDAAGRYWIRPHAGELKCIKMSS